MMRLFLILLLSISTNGYCQYLFNQVAFKESCSLVDKKIREIEEVIPNTYLKTVRLKLCDINANAYVSTSCNSSLLYTGPLRKIELGIGAFLRFSELKKKMNRTIPLNEELEIIKYYKENTMWIMFYDEKGGIKDATVRVLSQHDLEAIFNCIKMGGFKLMSDEVEDIYAYRTYSNGQEVITVSFERNPLAPNAFIEYPHYFNVRIIEKAIDFDRLEEEERKRNINLLTPGNFFYDFKPTIAYESDLDGKIKLNIEMLIYDNRKFDLIKDGVDYIEGDFIITNMFDDPLHIVRKIEIKTSDAMPSKYETYITQRWYYSLSLTVNNTYDKQLLAAIRQGKDLQVKFIPKRVRFSTGKILK